MSENLDLVRSIYADWERGDVSAADWAHPEIEFVVADGPTPGRWTGLAGMAEGERDFLSPLEDLRTIADEYWELDAERVLVLNHPEGRGKISGVDLAQIAPSRRGATLFHIRDVRVTTLVLYNDGDRALADLGLEE
jgi:ketosteroid isomerase-like protein